MFDKIHQWSNPPLGFSSLVYLIIYLFSCIFDYLFILFTILDFLFLPDSVLINCFLEKAMTIYSSTLAWRIPWMEEPGRLQSMGSPRVGHDWATSLSCIGEGKGNPLQYSCLEKPRDRRACWAAVYGVAQSQTRLTRFSSSSSSSYLLAVLFSKCHALGTWMTIILTQF